LKEIGMEILTMGKVVVAAKIENLHDVYNANRGKSPVEEIRSIDVTDALIDTGATLLSLPRRMIEGLGLERQRTRTARTAAGVVAFGVYEAVRLTVQGRDCAVEVMELPDECPVLIGQIPLEALDFIVDPVGQRLLGNPEHGGEQMVDVFSTE
jgi:predicted aspartyl protease